MQHTDQQVPNPPPATARTQQSPASNENPIQYRVIRRNGETTDFDLSKIQIAMRKAFLSVEGGQAAASSRIHERVEQLSETVFSGLFRHRDRGGTVHIEDIQDQVELAMMRSGEHKVARAYVLYREKQAENAPRLRKKLRLKKPLCST